MLRLLTWVHASPSRKFEGVTVNKSLAQQLTAIIMIKLYWNDSGWPKSQKKENEICKQFQTDLRLTNILVVIVIPNTGHTCLDGKHGLKNLALGHQRIFHLATSLLNQWCQRNVFHVLALGKQASPLDIPAFLVWKLQMDKRHIMILTADHELFVLRWANTNIQNCWILFWETKYIIPLFKHPASTRTNLWLKDHLEL